MQRRLIGLSCTERELVCPQRGIPRCTEKILCGWKYAILFFEVKKGVLTLSIDYREIKFVKNVKNSDKDIISYSQHKVHDQFTLWFADKPCKDKYSAGDIILLYQRLQNDSNATFTHLVKIIDKTPVRRNNGYELDVEVVGTVQVLKSVTSLCDYISFRGNGQSGKLVGIQKIKKGHIANKTVKKRLVEIFKELGEIA